MNNGSFNDLNFVVSADLYDLLFDTDYDDAAFNSNSSCGFLCYDGLTCIDSSQECDEVGDCEDESDEHEDCGSHRKRKDSAEEEKAIDQMLQGTYS